MKLRAILKSLYDLRDLTPIGNISITIQSGSAESNTFLPMKPAFDAAAIRHRAEALERLPQPTWDRTEPD